MVSNSMIFMVASALTAVGIVLGVANWYPRPEAALAWTASLAMFGVMCVALRGRDAPFVARARMLRHFAGFRRPSYSPPS